jgi:hypothetical protein
MLRPNTEFLADQPLLSLTTRELDVYYADFCIKGVG